MIGRKRLVALTVTVALVTPAAIFALAGPAAAVANQISTIAGVAPNNGYNQDGVSATNTELFGPNSVAVDPSGNVLIADSYNHRIRVTAESPTNPGYPLSGCGGSCTWRVGDIFTIAGTGTPGYNDDGISATTAEVQFPNGVAVDSAGNVLIADTNNHRIRVVAVSGSNPGYPLSGTGTDCPGSVCTWTSGDIFTIAGTGNGGYNADGNQAGVSELAYPNSVAVDAQDNVFIADTQNNLVRVVSVSGSNPGYPLSGTGTDCPGSVCTWLTGDIFTIAGDGNPGYNGDSIAAGTAELSAPDGVTVDSDSNVLITDGSNTLIRVVAVGSDHGYCGGSCTWTLGNIYTVAGTQGSGAASGDGTPANGAHLAPDGNVAIDAQGDLLVADYPNHRVRIVALSPSNPGYALRNQDCPGGLCTWIPGDIFTVAGVGSGGFNGDGIASTSAELSYPAGVAVDSSGNLLIADSNNHAIRKVLTGAALTGFTVPANASDPYGYDTGYSVNDSVTLSASGSWCYSGGNCFTPDGDGTLDPAGSGYLEPTAARAQLVGRIGTTGSWTIIGGTNPTSMNGQGELYLAMNDQLGSYGDNTGSVTVTIAAELNLSSEYQGDGPVLAGTDVGWDGLVTNTGATTQTNASLIVSDDTSQTTVPQWQTMDTTFSPTGAPQPCAVYVSPLYICMIGSLPPGYSTTVTVDHITTKAMAPQILTDVFALSSDQTAGSILPQHAQNASTSQEIDGLQFHITAPATVQDGATLHISGWVANTSATDPINAIATFSTIDKGTATGSVGCGFTNNASGGATDRCPSTGTFALPASTDTSSVPASLDLDTSGLAGQTIHYTTVATSPDLGGNSQVVTGSVLVTPGPGNIAITAPAESSTFIDNQPNTFSAVATPNAGNSILAVEFWDGAPNSVGSNHLGDITAPGPYAFTIGANSLSIGFHELCAQLDQSPSTFHPLHCVGVNVVDPPTITVNPPAGFSSGGTLNTSKAFTATVHPSAPATVKSVVWTIDGATISPITVPSLATAPYTAVVNPTTLVIPNGSHTLNATVTDSTGQTTTSADFNFTVPTATLSLGAITTSASQITPGGDTAWNVEVDNTSGNIAHHTTVTLTATATDALNNTTALAFDIPAINQTLHLSPTAPTCSPGTGASLVCTVVQNPASIGDLPGSSGVQFPVFVKTDPDPGTVGSTINGTVQAAAANAATTGTSALGAVSVISCGPDCREGVDAAGTTFDSGVDSSGTNDVSVTAPQGMHSIAHGVKLGHPFRLGSQARRHARITFRPRLELAAAVKVTLSSIDPLTATDPVDTTNLCNNAHPCVGKISGVDGDFSPFMDPTDPFVVTIIAKWGDTVPAGTSIWMQKPAGMSGLPPAIQLPACVINATTRAFNTPCLLPEIVKSLTVDSVTTKTTYDTVLFTGNDPHFARR